MTWLLLAARARGFDPPCDIDEVLADRPGVVAIGRVVQVDVAPVPDSGPLGPLNVRYHVELVRLLAGSVASGQVVIRSAPSSDCPSAVPLPLDGEVWVAASPENGTVVSSRCTCNAGPWTAKSDAFLRRLARRVEGRAFAGSLPVDVPAPLPTPFPEAGPERIRVVRSVRIGASGPSEERRVLDPIEGELIEPGAAVVRARFDVNGKLALALWVDRDGLGDVPVRRVVLAEQGDARVVLLPGAPVDADGRPVPTDGLTVGGSVAPTDRGQIWHPVEQEHGSRWLLRETDLRATLDGPVLAAFAVDRGLTVETTGPAVKGRVPVEVHTRWVTAVGWIDAAAVGPEASAADIGVAGDVIGPRSIQLHPGLELISTDRKGVFGRVLADEVWGRTVAIGKGTAVVAVDTPFGPMGAWISCRDDDPEAQGCWPE